MIRKVLVEEAETLAKLARQTFRETFSYDNTEEQLQSYFSEAYDVQVLVAELERPESETYFVEVEGVAVGYLKVNWGKDQTEHELEGAFEIQRLYVLREFQGFGLGKQLFEFALECGAQLGATWAWLGVWERNIKARNFYENYGFERFSEHHFPVGDKIDTDWLLKKKLK